MKQGKMAKNEMGKSPAGYCKFKRGDDDDEPHSRAFVWNILGAIWTQQNKPELIDLPFKEAQENGA